jgi:hypothetical protein
VEACSSRNRAGQVAAMGYGQLAAHIGEAGRALAPGLGKAAWVAEQKNCMELGLTRPKVSQENTWQQWSAFLSLNLSASGRAAVWPGESYRIRYP